MTLGAIRWSLRSNDVAGMQTNLAWETLLDLPATRPGPLHMRLAAAIRMAIRDGRIPREAALPPARRRSRRLPLDRHPGVRPARHRGVPDRADRLRDPGELDTPDRPRRGR